MKNLGSPVQRTLLRYLRSLIECESPECASSLNPGRQIPGMIVENIESTDWASLTFVGEVHRIDLRLTGVEEIGTAIRARLDALLADAEIVVPGHIVAEIAVVAVETRGDGVCLTIEALTLED